MTNNIFRGIFDSDLTNVISVTDFFLCIGTALLIGLIFAGMYIYRTRSSKSFVVTLALLPTTVCMVIMMVNGSVGAGVAVAGAFSLVRFRSAPGSAKEIGAIFLAMAAGLITGMGYLAYAILFSVIMAVIYIIYTELERKSKDRGALYKTLHITIPEDLDYDEVFEEIFKEYTSEFELTQVKTTNMGSMFRLTYNITLLSDASVKEMLNKLRCRNGNLEITVSKQDNQAIML